MLFTCAALRCILNITWQDKVQNKTVLERQHVHAAETETYVLARPRRAHGRRTDPKDLLYGELVQGKRPTDRPQLRFKDVCKRDLKALNIDQNNWEATALKRSAWRQYRKVSPSSKRHSLSSTKKENEKKGCSPCRQTSVRLHLCHLPQGLSFPHRTGARALKHRHTCHVY